MPAANADTAASIARSLTLPEASVRAALRLFADKATIPFIARYRKEATRGLDEVQLRRVEAEQRVLLELDGRRSAILAALRKQGQLTDELEERIRACTTKSHLEDLYLPFKPKRRTRAQLARERGLTPLAERILAQPRQGNPQREAQSFVDTQLGVPDARTALAGAGDIAAELIAEHSAVRSMCREAYGKQGIVQSTGIKKAIQQGPTKFEQYYDYREPVAKIPSHRYLAMRRGEQEGVLRVKIGLEQPDTLLRRILTLLGHDRRSPFGNALFDAVQDSYQRLLGPSIENETAADVKARAEAAAIEVFADNLQHLLLAAPLGAKAVLGIDPGYRTGCKCAAVDATGKLLEHATLYPHASSEQSRQAEQLLLRLLRRHRPAAVAIGNGTAGRETLSFVRSALKKQDLSEPVVVSVNESGASVYSASDLARREFPDLDVTIRGAISIARRLQDPLAELVKIDPQAIGVGQYQHDVPEAALRRRLDEVIESSVNHVGVELNTASAELLAHVAGVGSALSRAIVAYREENGPFRARRELTKVPKLGAKAFEQAAGFLRIHGARHPLDASAVHPERYPVVAQMAKDSKVELRDLVGNPSLVEQIDLARYVDEQQGLGLPTLEDIASELKKPGRDPRASFEPPKFRDDVQKLEDLQVGMHLQGVVTNVTAFGAFVDVGVHQDGLVHISELASGFVKNPADVVSVGDSISVRVLSLDLARKRISLSAKPAAS